MAAENTLLDHTSYTIAIVGDARTGKTALRQRVCESRFAPTYEMTYGLTLGTVIYPDYSARLQLCDCSGGSIYRPNLLSNLKTTQPAACILLFDLTYAESFTGLTTWLKEIQDSNPALSRDKILLVGTKIDREESRQVSLEQAEKFSKEQALMGYVEISAKTGKNVTIVFETILKNITSNNLPDKKSSELSFMYPYPGTKSHTERNAADSTAAACSIPSCSIF